MLFVQAKNVYPQLLLGRLFFSIGGAAASTMVTAILPAVAGKAEFQSPRPTRTGSPFERARDVAESESSASSRSVREDNDEYDRTASGHEDQEGEEIEDTSSEATITPTRLQARTNSHPPTTERNERPQTADRGNRAEAAPAPKADVPTVIEPSSSRVAGFVGVATGVGALISLGLFLPLPARFQKGGTSPGEALQDSYYIVAVVALVLSGLSFFGLQGLSGEDGKGFSTILRYLKKVDPEEIRPTERYYPFWIRFMEAFRLGLTDSRIGLGYVGGLVARASSVGISLFIPLAINAQFKQAGLCHIEALDTPGGLPDIKRRCPRAYTLAAELTGVSQLIALLAAPLFGYLSSRSRRNFPLMFGALAGLAGYVVFGLDVQNQRESVNGTSTEFVSMALIGISQIAAIVCSLGVLSDGIIIQGTKGSDDDSSTIGSDLEDGEERHVESEIVTPVGQRPESSNIGEPPNELDLLLGNLRHRKREQVSRLKGSVAGLYSFYGGAGILILTKAGGAMFDSLSFGSPFYIMAVFNALLFLSTVYSALTAAKEERGRSRR